MRARIHDLQRFRPKAQDHLVVVFGGEGSNVGVVKRDACLTCSSDLAFDIERGDVHGWRADEAGDEDIVGVLVQLARGAHLLEFAEVEHGDAITHGQRLGLVVRDVDGGHAHAALQVGDLRAGLHA